MGNVLGKKVSLLLKRKVFYSPHVVKRSRETIKFYSLPYVSSDRKQNLEKIRKATKMNKARNCVIPARHIPKSSSEWVKNGQLTTFFKEYLRKNLILIYETFLDLFSAVDSETTEPNFYHGLSGIAVMHYKMGTAFPRQQHRYWDRALDSIKRALNTLESRGKNPTTDSSLFYGAAGVYFVAAKIYRKTGYYKLAQAMTSQFLETVDLEKDSPASRLELDSGLSGYALGCIQLLNLWRDDVSS